MPFYRRLFPLPNDIIAIHREFVELAESLNRLASRGNRNASRQVRIVISSYEDFLADLEKIAERTVLLANEVVVSKYDSSRTGRPHTSGPHHLRDALPTSEKIDTGLPTGAIGYINMNDLDKFVYWKAQEYGSDHMVGREIVGRFFQPGVSDPDPSEFRQHALFAPTGKGKVAHFQNPIPEGRFIRDGLDLVERYWSAQMLAAAEDAISDLRTAEGLTRGRQSSRGRRERSFQRNFPRLKLTTKFGVRSPGAIRNAIDRL